MFADCGVLWPVLGLNVQWEAEPMTVNLNHKAFKYAKDLVESRAVSHDVRDDWSEHAPSADNQNEFLEKHGWDEYSNWFLGVNDDEHEHTKAHYEFPYGDFVTVHRCAVISGESRASQYDHDTIHEALRTLLRRIDESTAG